MSTIAGRSSSLPGSMMTASGPADGYSRASWLMPASIPTVSNDDPLPHWVTAEDSQRWTPPARTRLRRPAGHPATVGSSTGTGLPDAARPATARIIRRRRASPACTARPEDAVDGKLRAAHPFVGAVAESLVLPDRHRGLQLVDQRVARVEGLRPVRAGHADDNRQVTHGQIANPMDR